VEITNLTLESYKQLIKKSKKPVLVDFWAYWCGPCRFQTEVLNEVSEELEKHFKLCVVDIDREEEIALRHEVKSVPTFLIFVKGEVVKRLEGFHDKSKLLQELEEFMHKKNR